MTTQNKVNLTVIRKSKDLLFKTLETPYRQVFKAILQDKVIKATKYISPSLVIRLTRRTYGKKINNQGNVEISMTIGKPNFLEREFVKACVKAKEPFPVKMVQLKHQK
jgi:hypothetical protein